MLSLKSAGLVASALALGALAAPAQAQFGSILRSGTRAATASDEGGCGEGKKSSAGSRFLGGVLGGAASNAVGSTGVGGWVTLGDVEGELTDAIACHLNPDEQKQAAQATLEATRSLEDDGGEGAQVGDMAEWTSTTRDNVSGTSTVTGRDDERDDGLQCVRVTDVIIVDGEEARAEKRMCRRPPAARYAIVA